MDKLNISQVDSIFANGSYPIEFLLYYRQNLNTDVLRTALKKLSSIFWPVFGKYESGFIHFEKYNEADCFDEEVTNEEFHFQDSNENLFQQFSKI